MKGTVFIDNEEIGFAEFQIIDESMGLIQGDLNPTEKYETYRKIIQDLFDKKGIANIEHFNFKIVLEDRTILSPAGGIGIIDCSEFGEILVESAGLNLKSLKI